MSGRCVTPRGGQADGLPAPSAPGVPLVSVVVPSYRGVAWVTECLDSLAAQTLPHAAYEVVLVQNGPHDGTREAVAAWREGNPSVQVEYLESPVASVTAARNLALDHARGDYVTFVDDDDRVRPRFLESLARHAAPDRVPIVLGGWVEDDWDTPSFESHTGALLVRHAGRAYTVADLAMALHPVWGKLVETALARQVRFDGRLDKYADDTEFWLRLMAARPMRLVLTELSEDAAYLYRVRAGSISQFGAATTWDVHVEPALFALAAMADLAIADAALARARTVVMRAPYRRINEYLVEHPGDLAAVTRAIRERGLPDVPWDIVQAGLPRQLAIAETAAGPAGSLADALAERCRVTDVVTYNQPAPDPGTFGGLHLALRAERAVTWGLVGQLLERLALNLDEIRRQGAGHDALYSRSAGPVEHLLAAMLKLVDPACRWTAEILPGASPGGEADVEVDTVFQILTAALVEAGYTGREVPSTMMAFAGLVVATLADEVVDRSETDPGEQEPITVSVVVPTYDGDHWLGECLESLAVQTLSPERYEVIVVRNGPPSDAAGILSRVRASHPDVRFTLVEATRAGVSHARNLGLAAATGSHVTFVDDDDVVGPRYLSSLVTASRGGAVGVGLIVQEPAGDPSAAQRTNWLSAPLLAGGRNRLELDVMFHPAVAKLAPTAVAREVGFDEGLHFAEDTLFWLGVIARGDLAMAPASVGSEAAYHYRVRAGSATAAQHTFELMVERHLDAVAALGRVPIRQTDLATVRQRIASRFLATVVGWARARPEDREHVARAVLDRDLGGLPWKEMDPPLGQVVADVARASRLPA